MNPQTIGYVMYYSRVKRQLSQDELARFATCSQSSITSIENGRTKYYSRNQLLNICQHFHLDERFIEDEDLVSFMPKDFQKGRSILDCSVITARFISLGQDTTLQLKEKLFENGIIKKSDCPDMYFSSRTIYQIIKKIFKNNLSHLFGNVSDNLSLFNRQPSGTVFDNGSDSARNNFDNTSSYRRLNIRDFAYISSIVRRKVQDPFITICSKLSIDIKDDLDLIADFMKVVSLIKLAEQGNVKNTIEKLVKNYMADGKPPDYSSWV